MPVGINSPPVAERCFPLGRYSVNPSSEKRKFFGGFLFFPFCLRRQYLSWNFHSTISATIDRLIRSLSVIVIKYRQIEESFNK